MKIKKYLTRVSKFSLLPYVILAVVVAFSYHQLLGMYFWRDDYTGLYTAQQGNLLSNPIFAYPYQFSLLFNQLAWSVFGLNAFYNFLAMIVIYILASWLLFYFLQKLFSDKKLAFWCSLIFSAGYVGQDGMIMTMDGSNGLIALIFLLISLIFLIIYHQKKRKVLFIISLISFFLTLEISPHRVSSSLLILLILDWILSWKKINKAFVIRNFLFIFVFLIQSIVHPSVLLFGYQIRSSVSYSTLFFKFSPSYFLNFLGTFWNMIIPTSIQEQFNSNLEIPLQKLTLIKLWLSGLPLILFISFIIIYLKILRPSVYSLIKLGKIFCLVIIISLFWAKSIYQINADGNDLVAIFNGGILLMFLLIWIRGISEYKLLSLFSLVTLFGILGTFFLTIPDRILVSFHRYLLLPAFAPALLPIIFVTKEFYQKNVTKKRLAQLLVFMIALILISFRLIAAYTTQKEFEENYSQHAKKMYQDLKFFLPQIEKSTIIYIEGTNKQLQLAVGDAARVGYFGSEVAYAVHYKTQKENIILPQTLEEIPKLLKENSSFSLNDIHTFIYDENGLRDTSQIFKKLLLEKNDIISISSNEWKNEKNKNMIKFIPSSKIWTMLPFKISIPLKFSSSDKMKVEIFWEYNTYGLLNQDKSMVIDVPTDNNWHAYILNIPAGGEYLQTIYFSFPLHTSVEIGETKLKYIDKF